MLNIPDEVCIRVMTSAQELDLEAVAALSMLAWAGKVDEAGVRQRARRLGKRLAGTEATGHFMVMAQMGGELVGFGRIVRLDAEPGSWRLEGIVVHPGHRRKGIATAIVRCAIACARAHGATAVESQVHIDNAPSAALHERLNFANGGVFTDEDGDRLIRFRMLLDGTGAMPARPSIH